MFKRNTKNYILFFLNAVVISALLMSVFHMRLLPASVIGAIDIDIRSTMTFSCCGSRAAGYSYFIKIISIFTESIFVLKFIQIYIFSLSVIFLSYQFFKLTESKLLSILLLFSILLNFKISKYGYLISEEALYIPALIFFAGCLIMSGNIKSNMSFIFVGLFAGILIAVKSIGVSIIPLVLIFLILITIKNRPKFLNNFIALFLPLFFVIFIETWLYSLNHSERIRTLGVNLLGKIPLISIQQPYDSKFPDLANLMYERGKLIRGLVDKGDSFYAKQFLRNSLAGDYHDLGGIDKDVDKEIKKYIAISSLSREDVTKNLFLEFFAVNKIEYLKFTILNYLGVWHLSEIMVENDIDNINSILVSNYFLNLPQNMNLHLDKHSFVVSKYAKIAPFARLFMIIAFLSSIILLVVGYSRAYGKLKNGLQIDALTIMALIFPILLHTYFIIVATVINIQLRYVLTYWPIIMINILLLFYFLVNHSRLFNNKMSR
jgi:hypothetical protein